MPNNIYLLLVLPLTILFFVFLISIFNKSNISLPTNRNIGIDALRGLSAISVFFYHYILLYYWIITGKWTAQNINTIDNLGSIPVSFFFMTTSYLFIGKIINYDNIKWKDIYISRIFRIYPLYLIVVLLIITFYYIFCNVPDIYTLIIGIIRWGAFQGVNIGDFDAKRVIAGVQWTLVYEAIFYMSLPVIHMVLRRKYNMGNLIFSLISALVIISYALSYTINYSMFAIFIFGIIPHLTKNIYVIEKLSFSKSISLVLLIVFIYSLFLTSPYSIHQEIMVGLIFIFICNGNFIFGILKNKVIFLLGELSYSIYLLHGVVLFLIYNYVMQNDITISSYTSYILCFPIIFIVVISISTVTYKYIEIKGIEIGRSLVNGLDLKNLTKDSSS